MTSASTKKHGQSFVGGLMPAFALKTRARAEAWSRKPHLYRPLAIGFRHNGFNYRQITRETNVAIYEQRCPECTEPSIAYEVIRVRRRTGFQIGGRFIEPAEVYTNSEDWGSDGFTFTNKEAAFAKLRHLRSKR